MIAQAAGDLRWLRVEDPSAAAACRGAALALAGRLEFPAARTDQLTLAVTEAASNLHKHASQGAMLLRIGRDGGSPDRDGDHRRRARAGDTSAALRDGHSTSGTLGIGLGAIRRLADFCELYSAPATARCSWPSSGPTPRPDAIPYAGLVRPITGETECGDVFGVVETDASVTGVLCDGSATARSPPSRPMEAVTAILGTQ